MKTIDFKEMFGSDTIESSSVAHFATFLGRELGRRGLVLDMSAVQFDEDLLTDTQRLMLHHQAKAGNIVLNKEISGYLTPISLSEKLSYLEDNAYVRTSDDGKSLEWDTEYARLQYGTLSFDLFAPKEEQYTIASVVARHVVDWVLGVETRTLTLQLTHTESVTGKNFLWLLDVLDTFPVLSDTLNVSLNTAERDLDYTKFMFGSHARGRRRQYTIHEKFEHSKSLGIVSGSICVMWTRSRIDEKNNYGKIQSRVLVRVDSINARGIRLTTIAEPFTKEERFIELSQIDEDKQYAYDDLIRRPLNTLRTSSDLSNTAFGNYLLQEEYVIIPIDVREETTKIVSVFNVDGTPTVGPVLMGAHDAIHWVLKQAGFEFDQELYKQMYYKGSEQPAFDQLSWEMNQEKD